MQKKGFVKQITGNSSFCLVEMGNKQQRKERERGGEDTSIMVSHAIIVHG